MYEMRKAVKSLVCVCLLATGVAEAATINGQVGFLGGSLGTWSINFTSSDPQIQLQKVVITLPANYGFDTQSGGFGLLLSQDFQKVSGGANAVGLTPATKAGRDGASQVGIDFSAFTAAAGTYTFLLDVDGVAPALATCSGNIFQIAACTAANLARTTSASTVDANEIAGTTAYFTFGGPGYNAASFWATLGNAGGPLSLTAQQAFSGEVVPESSTYALIGVGLAALGLLRRRRH